MIASDREEFDRQLDVLFGGFKAFLTPNRKEAFWRGLQKMQLSTFVRCVDHALGEKGDGEMPTTNRVWQISRMLHARARVDDKPTQQQFDDFHTFGQRCLKVFLLNQQDIVDEATLQRLIGEKNRIVQVYRSSGFDEDEDAAEIMRTRILDAFRRVMMVRAA